MAACNYYGTNGISINTEFVESSTSSVYNITYNINWYNVMFNLLPSMYRPYRDGNVFKRLKFYKFLQVSISQLKQFYESVFLKDRRNFLYLSRVNNQKIVLEKYFRDRFNDCSITISNNYLGIDLTYLYRDTEVGNADSKEYWLRVGETNPDQTYLIRQQEALLNADATLYVPVYLITNGITTIAELNAIMFEYMNVCNTWNIVTF